MAVRQYIGARYVPLYAGDWDATKNYEPLTIVTDANGNSFTSLKDVPAGTALTDRDYWIQTSSFSAAVDALQRRMNDAESDISTAQSDISGLQTDVTDLNDKVDKLKLNKNTVVLIGDSWFSNIPSIPAYIQNHYDCILKNYSVAGTGFDVGGGYKEQLNTMANDPSINLDDVRFVIISAGLNDHARGATAEQFATMFNEWKELYNSKFSGHAIPPVYWFADYSLENDKVSALGPNPTDFYSQYVYYRTVLRSVKEINSSFGFCLLPGTSDAWQTANWRHPSESGGIGYAENICKIIDGTPHIEYVYQEVTGTVRGTSETFNFRFYFENGEVKCEIIAKESVLAGVTSAGLIVDLSHNLPVNIPSFQSIGCGVLTGTYRYDDKTISFIPATGNVNVLYAGSSGTSRKFVTCARLI